MAILDHRLTLTEDRLSGIVAHQRGLMSVPVHTVSKHDPEDGPDTYSYNDDSASGGASGSSGESSGYNSEEDDAGCS